MTRNIFTLFTGILTLTSSFSEELEGVRAPAAGPCPTVEEAISKMKVPEGYQVKNFASEPLVVNPVAMSWDHRGRLWVVELYEYPLGAPQPNAYAKIATDEAFHPVLPGGATAPRDRIVILEDTDGDGKADKRTVFLEGLSLATAVLTGYDGVFVGQAPNLFYFRDTNGDDKADEYKTLLTGFGLEDRHELLNSFTWGPDGQLYFTHGVFTHSQVHRPGAKENSGMKLDAGIFRLKIGRDSQTASPVITRFEVYSDGTSNPWGVDFDATGNAFVEACVIDHLFHMAPGGLYSRQGGSPENPYGYELLPSIVHHKHFRAAYAGIQVYQGGAYPADTTGHVFFGNIHDNAIHEEEVTPVGASFAAKPVRDFLRAENGWFRPVSTQTGPDGCLWIMDWCDKYPCYQNAQANPAGVDREKGRIWRVVHEKSPQTKALRLDTASDAELVANLAVPNNWLSRRSAQVLRERFQKGKFSPELLAAAPKPTLEGFRLQHQFGVKNVASSGSVAERIWSATLTNSLPLLEKMASDPEPSVRSAVAVALRLQATPHLTVTLPDPKVYEVEPAQTGPALEALILASAQNPDATLPFQIWMALEPKIAFWADKYLSILAKVAPKAKPLSVSLVQKAVRRTCDARRVDCVDQSLKFLEWMGGDPELLAAGLSGLLKAQEATVLKPDKVNPEKLLATWRASDNQKVRALANKLSTMWGDAAAIQELVQKATEPQTPLADRISALQTLRKQRGREVADLFASLLAVQGQPEPLMKEILLAAGEVGAAPYPELILKAWPKFSANLKATAAQVFTSRAEWAKALLGAVAAGKIRSGEISPIARRWFATAAPAETQKQAEAVLGRWNETKAELKTLIAAKRKACLEGEPDLAAGRNIFMATCGVCHAFHGGGKNVGPDLISNGRSSLDSLLNNIIDPNQVIGRGYENVTISTKDGRTVAGRVVEDTPNQVKLVGINEATEIVAKDQIAKREDSVNSLMPEGFGALPDDIVRNLVWFILSPPEEGPLTAAKKAELSLAVTEAPEPAPTKAKENSPKIDWESVSLWAPEWKVSAPEFEGSPKKLTEFQGRKNVLQLHPFDQPRGKPTSLQRSLTVPSAKSVLNFQVAAHDQGNWMLVVLINGEEVTKAAIEHDVPRWKEIQIPLEKWAGQKIEVELQGRATDWQFEFSYWQGLTVKERE